MTGLRSLLQTNLSRHIATAPPVERGQGQYERAAGELSSSWRCMSS